jgi:DNA-binding GntR family transcriptional regulator
MLLPVESSATGALQRRSLVIYVCDVCQPVDSPMVRAADTMTSDSSNGLAIPRQSLPLAVATSLRDQIIRGEIPEGALLRQDALAKQYQVSRIPVREALRQLEAEGLITILPNRGAIVPMLSPDDIEELFGIRALLEPEVFKLSIPRLTQADLAEAEAVLRKYETELRREKHLETWGRLNWQFHATLYSRAERPVFMSIIRNVNNSAERYTRLQLYLTHGMKRAIDEHYQMFDLCRKRDVSAACRLLRQHILYAGQSLKQALQERRAALSTAF